jgi:hypothetical protein
LTKVASSHLPGSPNDMPLQRDSLDSFTSIETQLLSILERIANYGLTYCIQNCWTQHIITFNEVNA